MSYMFSFPVKPGENLIKQESSESMISKWMTYESEYFDRAMKKRRRDNLKVYGWPHNLLIPKGNSDGYKCQLFAMVSTDVYSVTKKNGFADDDKPLGFPFDRPTGDTLHLLSDFSADYDNMMTIDTKITFMKD